MPLGKIRQCKDLLQRFGAGTVWFRTEYLLFRLVFPEQLEQFAVEL